jgi:hypothetical protein
MYRGCIIKKLLLVLIFPFASLYAADFETDVSFRNFPWGTSMEEFIRQTGDPISREEINGLVSLAWANVDVKGYTTFMVAYFSRDGLQGGTYYFLTRDMDELTRCYGEMRQELRDRYGPTWLFNGMIKELRPYECSWHLSGGYVYLKVNTRTGEPVTLWYSSPELSQQLFGDRESYTAQR